MSHGWYYKTLDEEFGPVPFPTLVELAENGNLTPDDAVREGARGQWRRAGDVYGLVSRDEDWTDLLSQFDSPPPAAGEEPNALEESAADDSVELESFWKQHSREGSQHPTDTTDSSDDLEDFYVDEIVDDDEGEQATPGEAWYGRVLGQELGPMPFSDLLQLAERGEITEDDQVRSEAGEWVDAASVPELNAAVIASRWMKKRPSTTASQEVAEEDDFELASPEALGEASAVESPTEGQADEAAAAEKDFSVESRQPTAASEEETAFADSEEPAAPVDSDSSGSIYDHRPIDEPGESQVVARPRGVWPTAPPKRSPPTKRVPVRPGAKLVVGVAAAVLGIVLMVFLAVADTDDDNYRTINAVWQDYQALRSDETNREDWESFVADARAKLDPVIAELERSAHADAPAKQHMLWASRDYLLMLLDDTSVEIEDTEKEFVTHMNEASRLIATDD